jgi:3-methyl-2-oxobutanoate hydroxymethyltransferase
VIGIGAGGGTHGQVLVYHDLLGLGDGRIARFVRQYAQGRADQVDAVRRWADDVRTGRFPSGAETYGIADDVMRDVRRALDG